MSELLAAGLADPYLAVATREGRLLRIDTGVYVLPDAPARALEMLAGISQPFTLSQARQALGTTRRVAVPLLELLDRQHATQRLDAQHRALRR